MIARSCFPASRPKYSTTFLSVHDLINRWRSSTSQHTSNRHNQRPLVVGSHQRALSEQSTAPFSSLLFHATRNHSQSLTSVCNIHIKVEVYRSKLLWRSALTASGLATLIRYRQHLRQLWSGCGNEHRESPEKPNEANKPKGCNYSAHYPAIRRRCTCAKQQKHPRKGHPTSRAQLYFSTGKARTGLSNNACSINNQQQDQAISDWVVTLVESNPGSVNVAENITTLVVHRANDKAEDSSNRRWTIEHHHESYLRLCNEHVKDWLHWMCSSIYHYLYVVDLPFPLNKGNEKRAANVYDNEQHLELD
jgi:hypothetical protein